MTHAYIYDAVETESLIEGNKLKFFRELQLFSSKSLERFFLDRILNEIAKINKVIFEFDSLLDRLKYRFSDAVSHKTVCLFHLNQITERIDSILDLDQDNSQPDQLVNQFVKCKQELSEAEKASLKLIDETYYIIEMPDECLLWVNHGVLLCYLNKIDEAERAFKNGLDCPSGWGNLGFILLNQDRISEAERAFRKKCEHVFDSSHSWSSLGTVLFRKNELSAAENALIYALVADITNNIAAFQLGRVLLAEGILSTDIQDHCLNNPDFTTALGLRFFGEKYHREGKEYKIGLLNRAEESYKSAIAYDPSLAIVWANLSDIYRLKKSWQEAEDAINESFKLDHTSEVAWMNLGLLKKEKMYFIEAIEAFERALSFAPREWEYFNEISELLRECKENKDQGITIEGVKQETIDFSSIQLSISGFEASASEPIETAEHIIHCIVQQTNLTKEEVIKIIEQLRRSLRYSIDDKTDPTIPRLLAQELNIDLGDFTNYLYTEWIFDKAPLCLVKIMPFTTINKEKIKKIFQKLVLELENKDTLLGMNKYRSENFYVRDGILFYFTLESAEAFVNYTLEAIVDQSDLIRTYTDYQIHRTSDPNKIFIPYSILAKWETWKHGKHGNAEEFLKFPYITLESVKNTPKIAKILFYNSWTKEIIGTEALHNCIHLKSLEIFDRIGTLEELHFPSHLSVLNLEKFVISGTKLQLIDLSFLQNSPNIREIYVELIHEYYPTKVILPRFDNHLFLEKIVLQGNKMESISFSSPMNCPNLKEIDLSNNELKTIDLSSLQLCSDLRELDLSDNLLDIIDLSPLQKCRNLRSLKIGGFFPSISLPALPRLKHLSIFSPRLKSINFQGLKEKYPCLEEFHLISDENTSLNLIPLKIHPRIQKIIVNRELHDSFLLCLEDIPNWWKDKNIVTDITNLLIDTEFGVERVLEIIGRSQNWWENQEILNRILDYLVGKKSLKNEKIVDVLSQIPNWWEYNPILIAFINCIGSEDTRVVKQIIIVLNQIPNWWKNGQIMSQVLGTTLFTGYFWEIDVIAQVFWLLSQIPNWWEERLISEVIIYNLTHKSFLVRKSALKALISVPWWEKVEVYRTVINSLQDENDYVREAALEIIGQLPDWWTIESIFEIFTKCLEDTETKVRKAALLLIGTVTNWWEIDFFLDVIRNNLQSNYQFKQIPACKVISTVPTWWEKHPLFTDIFDNYISTNNPSALKMLDKFPEWWENQVYLQYVLACTKKGYSSDKINALEILTHIPKWWQNKDIFEIVSYLLVHWTHSDIRFKIMSIISQIPNWWRHKQIYDTIRSIAKTENIFYKAARDLFKRVPKQEETGEDSGFSSQN
ncbi:MAG: leucine-rich repeat domain-containing protein [Candidatus Hodarchaeales archaeon]|jgi:tetratricopeptide (TPR) repeat protein